MRNWDPDFKLSLYVRVMVVPQLKLQPYKNNRDGLLFKILVSSYLKGNPTAEASNHFSFKELFLMAKKKIGKPPIIVVILNI